MPGKQYCSGVENQPRSQGLFPGPQAREEDLGTRLVENKKGKTNWKPLNREAEV